MAENHFDEQTPSRDPHISESLMARLPDTLKSEEPYTWVMSGVNALATTPTGREIGQIIGPVVYGDVNTVRQML
jgi:hypothetical protein